MKDSGWMSGKEINAVSRNIKEIEDRLGRPIPPGMYFDVDRKWMDGRQINAAVRNIEEVERTLGRDKDRRADEEAIGDLVVFAAIVLAGLVELVKFLWKKIK